MWIILFPEGTRTERGQTGAYHSGGARLAIRAGVPVVPVAVTSGRCWPARAFVKRPGIVDFSIGPAIASEGRRADELMREAAGWIEAEMRRLDPEAYAHEGGASFTDDGVAADASDARDASDTGAGAAANEAARPVTRPGAPRG